MATDEHNGIEGGNDGGVRGIAGIDIIEPIGTIRPAPNGAIHGDGTGNGGGRGGTRRTRKDGTPDGRTREGREAKAASSPDLGGSKKTTPSTPIKPEDIATGIMIAHMMLERYSPRFHMDQPEADQLATAICNYLRHTKVKVDAKTRDFWTLLFVLATVEGTRIFAFVNDKSHEAKIRKANQQRAAEGRVVPIDATKGGVFTG